MIVAFAISMPRITTQPATGIAITNGMEPLGRTNAANARLMAKRIRVFKIAGAFLAERPMRIIVVGALAEPLEMLLVPRIVIRRRVERPLPMIAVIASAELLAQVHAWWIVPLPKMEPRTPTIVAIASVAILEIWLAPRTA